MQPVGFPYNFSLREHLRHRSAERVPPLAWPGAGDPAAAALWRAELTRRLRELTGAPDSALPAPQVAVLDTAASEPRVLTRLAVQVAADLATPACLLSPADPAPAWPGVLGLGVAAAGKAALSGELSPPGGGAADSLGGALCRAGLLVLIPDLPGCGERADHLPSLQASLLATGDSLAAWTLRESLSLLACLRSQPEVPAGQIGLVATGDTVPLALVLAALDPGVKAVAVCGDLDGFDARLVGSNCLQPGTANPWPPEWFLPGLAAAADPADLAALLAPRPLLAMVGATETPGLLRVREAYQAGGWGPRCELQDQAPPQAFAALAAEFLSAWLPVELSDLPAPPPAGDRGP